MTEFFIAFIVFALFFVALSLSLLFRKKPLKGSCGGVASLMGNKECKICGGDPNRCDASESTKPESSQNLYTDASKK